ncbi:permease [Niallia circulans]
MKWWPYYHKAILSFQTNSIGDSILQDQISGTFTWSAAVDYTVTYFQSVWKAAILGILLGSLVQVLLPTGWLLKVLGKTSFGSTAAAGLASIPGMMCTCCAAPVAVGLRKKMPPSAQAWPFGLGIQQSTQQP